MRVLRYKARGIPWYFLMVVEPLHIDRDPVNFQHEMGGVRLMRNIQPPPSKNGGLKPLRLPLTPGNT